VVSGLLELLFESTDCVAQLWFPDSMGSHSPVPCESVTYGHW
jgi:hypothetical protein